MLKCYNCCQEVDEEIILAEGCCPDCKDDEVYNELMKEQKQDLKKLKEMN